MFSGPKSLSAPSWPLKLRFDKSSQQLVVAPAPPPPTEQTVQQLTWDGEPATVQDLLNCYNMECKCLARWGGTTLYLVDARNRMGKTESVVEGQAFKLFMETSLNCRALFMGISVISVKTCEAAQSLQALGIQNRFSKGAHLNIQIPTDEFVIGHGASRFISDVKLADLKRKNKSGRPFPD